jgi:hypothetical protein
MFRRQGFALTAGQDTQELAGTRNTNGNMHTQRLTAQTWKPL